LPHRLPQRTTTTRFWPLRHGECRRSPPSTVTIVTLSPHLGPPAHAVAMHDMTCSIRPTLERLTLSVRSAPRAATQEASSWFATATYPAWTREFIWMANYLGVGNLSASKHAGKETSSLTHLLQICIFPNTQAHHPCLWQAVSVWVQQCVGWGSACTHLHHLVWKGALFLSSLQ
jgi:hypothetical protein